MFGQHLQFLVEHFQALVRDFIRLHVVDADLQLESVSIGRLCKTIQAVSSELDCHAGPVGFTCPYRNEILAVCHLDALEMAALRVSEGQYHRKWMQSVPASRIQIGR